MPPFDPLAPTPMQPKQGFDPLAPTPMQRGGFDPLAPTPPADLSLQPSAAPASGVGAGKPTPFSEALIGPGTLVGAAGAMVGKIPSGMDILLSIYLCVHPSLSRQATAAFPLLLRLRDIFWLCARVAASSVIPLLRQGSL